MKFTLVIELPDQQNLAYSIELSPTDWAKLGFDPYTPEPYPELADPSKMAEYRYSVKRWRQLDNYRRQRQTSLNELMRRLGKQALRIIEMQDKETQYES